MWIIFPEFYTLWKTDQIHFGCLTRHGPALGTCEAQDSDSSSYKTLSEQLARRLTPGLLSSTSSQLQQMKYISLSNHFLKEITD